MEKEYDVCILGAGPAGLFAADRLSKENYKVLVIDKKRIPGGAGALTDAKLIFHPRVGMELEELGIEAPKAYDLMDYIEKTFLSVGIDPTRVSDANSNEGKKLALKAAKYGLEFILSKTRHIGTDKAPGIMKNFKEKLEKQNVEFMMGSEVEDISKSENFETKLADGSTINSKYLIYI